VIATTLHQIEISSRCCLSCPYCLWPILTRPKQDMPALIWEAAMRWLAHFIMAGTQGDLVLTGTGESTLHPDLCAMVAEARQVLGNSQRLLLTTNGIGLTDAHVSAFVAANVRCYVSLHRPEKAERAVWMLAEAGLLEQAVMDPVLGANSWAGQVDWPDRIMESEQARKPVCPWLSRGWLFCASDGTLYDCCYANGTAPVRGHVSTPVQNISPQPWQVCPKCWQRPPTFHELSPEVTR